MQVQRTRYSQTTNCTTTPKEKAPMALSACNWFKSSRNALICRSHFSSNFVAFSNSVVKSYWAVARSTQALNSSRTRGRSQSHCNTFF